MRVPEMLTDLGESVIRLLYPPCCRSCGEPLDEEEPPVRLCPTCVADIEMIDGPVCERCGHPILGEDSIHGKRCRNCPEGEMHYHVVRSAVAYDGAVRALIHAYKFRFHTNLAPHLAAYLTAPYWKRLQGEIDVIVPVPLHWFRHKWREFNQSEELARHLGEKVRLPVMASWLKRERWTKTQSTLRSEEEKRANVRGAFKAPQSAAVAGCRILLIDDVFTTGHTANECARVLKEAGAPEVSVLTVARVAHGRGGTPQSHGARQ